MMESLLTSQIYALATPHPKCTSITKGGKGRGEAGFEVDGGCVSDSRGARSCVMLSARCRHRDYAVGFKLRKIALHRAEGVKRNRGLVASVRKLSADQSHPVSNEIHQSQLRSSSSESSSWNILRRFALYTLAIVLSCGLQTNFAHAVAENSIGASSLGFKVAKFLRRSGLYDEVVVLVVAMLPVLELRGAIPVSYWLQLPPVNGYILAVIGNMIPVPFIVLYLEKISNFVGEKSKIGQTIMRWVFETTRKRAAPIEEFHWLGLLFFVAVPLPGTGAWSGAIAASILQMPFWDAVTANFFGVAVAGLIVNVCVTIGVKEALIFGALLFTGSFFMWKMLRMIQQKNHS